MNKLYKKQLIDFIYRHEKGFRKDYKKLFNQFKKVIKMNKFYKKQFIDFIYRHEKGFRKDYKRLFNQLNMTYEQEQIFKKCQNEFLMFFESLIATIKVLDFENNDLINNAYKDNLLNFISHISGYYIKNYQILFNSLIKTDEQKQLFNELENTLIAFIYLIYSNIKYTNNII